MEKVRTRGLVLPSSDTSWLRVSCRRAGSSAQTSPSPPKPTSPPGGRQGEGQGPGCLWAGAPGAAHGPLLNPQTQPVPNPMAYVLHRSPWWFHRFETLSNHFLELVVPFFIFLGRSMCILHGALQILFQVSVCLSAPSGHRLGSSLLHPVRRVYCCETCWPLWPPPLCSWCCCPRRAAGAVAAGVGVPLVAWLPACLLCLPRPKVLSSFCLPGSGGVWRCSLFAVCLASCMGVRL